MAAADSALEGESSRTPGGAGVSQVALPANRKAPSAARTLLALCVGAHLGERVLSDAQLLITELVTNSLVHAQLGEQDSIVVRIRLDAHTLRLAVVNPGNRGTIATEGSDPENGRGFGLDLVSALSTDWGVRRDEDTCVWADVARA
jgi:anti-sigma regulatory factor (Ser/Thr protein kinase)